MAGETKTEPQQRVRIGLTGLAVVFLLVLLGTAISRSGDDSPLPSNLMVNAAPEEPLAEIGAAPSQGASGNEGNAAAPAK